MKSNLLKNIEMKVFIVDDLQANLDFFKDILSSEFEVEGFTNPHAALVKIQTSTPDLVLVDCLMPGMDGHELISRIKKDRPELPIIMISGHRYEENLLKALDLMADDFIFKPVGQSELIARIKSKILKAKKDTDYSEDKVEDVIEDVRFDDINESAYFDDEKIELKTKEYRLLKFLVKKRNQIVTREDIFVNVWEDIFVSPATLDTHICQLRKKMNKHGSKIVTRKNSGFVYTSDENTIQ